MLSTEMPIHQLSKKTVEEIRIIRREGKGGQISLYWKVEANSNVGHPGQLAYHLDTWVIKRRLAELRRPIPRLIRVGDLREIARELGQGGDTNAVKRAFEQNASAFIRAKLAFSSKEGVAETFEGYFNRYNVFFRGQTLPGGRAAETVYLSLNDPYFTLINRSRWRPLDYEYLKSLPPMAQRFYELVSPKMFAAIKNGHPAAWMRYSDFCALAVQKQHATRRRMQIQMAAVHRSHLMAGYIGSVSYRPVASPTELPDWTIHYVPGRRARTEFAVFNGGRIRPTRATRRATASSPVRRALEESAEGGQTPAAASPAGLLAATFAEKRFGISVTGVTPNQMRRAQAILDSLDGDYETAQLAVNLAATESRNDPRGFPKHIGGVLEGGFIERARAHRAEETRRREKTESTVRERGRRERYDAWCLSRARVRIAELTEAARRDLIDERLPRFVEEFKYFFQLQSIGGERVKEWAEPRILQRYGREGEPTFDEWCRLHDTTEPTGTVRPDEALQ
jgi:hypothetical protein